MSFCVFGKTSVMAVTRSRNLSTAQRSVTSICPGRKRGGLAGGICAIYIPTGHHIELGKADENGHYETPLSQPLERAPSLDIAMEFASLALRLEEAGGWKLCRNGKELDETLKQQHVRRRIAYGRLRSHRC
jgi:hypothetical protein